MVKDIDGSYQLRKTFRLGVCPHFLHLLLLHQRENQRLFHHRGLSPFALVQTGTDLISFGNTLKKTTPLGMSQRGSPLESGNF